MAERKSIHPYRPPAEIGETVTRLHPPDQPIVHPQRIIEGLRHEKTSFGQFNGWLADHIVGIAGTMVFFYFLCFLLAGWALWQSAVSRDRGFDPFPYSFLFFILGGIMQSLFVPTMLTAQNRQTQRDQIKDEADHRSWSRLYEINDEQITILRKLADELLSAKAKKPDDET